VLDTQFDFTSRIQDTRRSWATVKDVYDRREACVIASVLHNNIVPTLKIGILLDEVWKGIPLVLGSDKTGVATELVERRAALDEIIGGPLKSGVVGRNESWITKSSRVGL
jgi:hypothetical protein